MTLLDVFCGEVRKARTQPALILTVVLSVVLPLAYCLVEAKPQLGLSTPQSAGVYGMANLSFFVAIVGVLIASAEYSGGQLSVSFLAVAQRGKLVAAKLILSAIVSTMVAVIFAFFIATLVQAPLGDRSVYANGTASSLLTSLAYAVGSWTALGVISTCAALIVRSPSIILAAMVLLSFGGTPLMMAVPIFQYLPTNAGVLMYIDRENQTADWLNPPDITVIGATGTLAAWVLSLVCIAVVVFKRRDSPSRHAVAA